MTYRELPVGQEIEISEREPDVITGRTRTVRKQYTVAAKYPHMCIVEDRKGRKRGLTVGDLIINGTIRQDAELEASRKEPCERAWRKRGEGQ